MELEKREIVWKHDARRAPMITYNTQEKVDTFKFKLDIAYCINWQILLLRIDGCVKTRQSAHRTKQLKEICLINYV